MSDNRADERPAPQVPDSGGLSEKQKERGASWRVFIYIAGSHLLLAFLALLFYLGSHAQK
ncbi:putative hypothetical protein [Streptomyces sp. NBRC 110611]|uniref:DUF6126 family protein n=1 Tax=Streptomyces sp. NBRC 110611 TaxID=1621259 RepID=UPI00082EEB0D|nr:DUF6126 family protein [Streptomyces sp. NBRC 110611]GAU71369.1 putative hypothetical protein [Streptomyces sp. NBRC 110611]